MAELLQRLRIARVRSPRVVDGKALRALGQRLQLGQRALGLAGFGKRCAAGDVAYAFEPAQPCEP